jgi:hypothetical protein
MVTLTDKDKEQAWEEVRKEFPDDEMMQQIHYVRLLHYYQTRDMSSSERVNFFNKVLEKPKKASRAGLAPPNS